MNINDKKLCLIIIGGNYFAGSLYYTNISDRDVSTRLIAAFLISAGLYGISAKKRNISVEYAKSSIYMGSSLIIPNSINKIVKNYKKYKDY